MSNFTGGSAAAMARQVADGSLPVTESSLERLSGVELDAFSLAVGELRHEIREQPPPADVEAVRARNLKIQRLNTCGMMLRTYRQRRRS